jgi:hypothetical protein
LIAQNIIAGLLSIMLLAACSENAAQIEPPESWQSHLKPANLDSNFNAAAGGTIYVPVYSSIYLENNRKMTDLTGTLSIRNTDLHNPIILKFIDYYSTDGKLVTHLMTQPLELAAMGAADVVVPRTHVSGGTGANFLVEWTAAEKVSEPLVEAVMVNAGAGGNISFVSRGVVVSGDAVDATRTSPAPAPARSHAK